MQVKEIIERLTRDYAPDTELYVEWWDKDTIESLGTSDLLTDAEWVEVVERMADYQLPINMIDNAAVDQADDIIKNRTKGKK
jgi:hypothetical protein